MKEKFPTRRSRKRSLFLLLPLLLGLRVAAADPAAAMASPAMAEPVVLPPSVPDPLEPLNRVFWAFNRAFMRGIIQPTSRIYRWVVVKPVRTSIGNFGRNLKYPGRLINNLLQQKWPGARDETYRFLCNSTVGVAGLFDVGTRWKIPASEADFGQTFGRWGWQPACYIMLPFFGPSNERDTLGLAADTATNPLLYISPYDLVASDPLTYLGPYTYFTYAVTYNDLSDSVNEFVRFSRAESDPYAQIQYAWTFARANRVADFQVTGELDEAAHQTLASVFFTPQDSSFSEKGLTKSVRIPATGRNLPFTCWLQPRSAPIVYIVPGLGSHRLDQSALALAELVFGHGFSAVTLSNPFNSEFMEHAATTALPGYLPVDGRDLHAALTAIDGKLATAYPNRLGSRSLLGDSLGAFDTLYVAATAATNELPRLQFDHYVAIDTPVRLLHGVTRLDEFYQAPAAWPAAERAERIENTFLKVAALSKTTLTPQTSLPFNAIESRFLIGMTFRFLLRDIIYSSQQRHNQGVLGAPLHNFHRTAVYHEIMGYSFQDYLEKFVAPYYEEQGVPAPAVTSLATAGDLRQYAAGLRANPRVRVLVNRNDFLLAEEDLAWLQATFAPDRLTVFEKGGHLGNLFNPSVQAAIIEALRDGPAAAVSPAPHQP